MKGMNEPTRDPASFRDPAGFVFRENGLVLRQVNKIYAPHYDHLMQSGLYTALVERNWMISHLQLPDHKGVAPNCAAVIKPVQLQSISYAYEWSFDMLKDAALLTLSINKIAMEFGMILKDASTFNIQFLEGKPLFIDTLSFESYNAAQPWKPYRQFCRQFLFPLVLMSYGFTEAQKLLLMSPEGLSLSFTAGLLPLRSWFSLSTVMHIHMQQWIRPNTLNLSKPASFSSVKMNHLLTNLQQFIQKIRLPKKITNWNNYYQTTILGKDYLEEKAVLVAGLVKDLTFSTAIDLGANNGHFSRLLAARAIQVIAVDADEYAINELYNKCSLEGKKNILPLLIDLLNPSTALGFMNTERPSFLQRYNAGLVLALALVHHLYFTGNVPLPRIAILIASLTTRYAIVEFVLAEDEKLQLVSATKQELQAAYTQSVFEEAFCVFFNIRKKISLANGNRYLYLLEKQADDAR
jgi:hypothetical protein